MKLLTSFLAFFVMALGLTLTSTPAFAGGGGFQGEPFTKVIYVKFGGATTNSGSSYDAAKGCAADQDLWAIPAGMLITKAYMILDTAVTGSTNMDIGDDDDPDGFIDSSLSVTLATPAMYGYNAKTAGAYLRVETAGATDALDLYVVPTGKYYTAAKTLKMDLTTACTAGRFRIVIEGVLLGTK